MLSAFLNFWGSCWTPSCELWSLRFYLSCFLEHGFGLGFRLSLNLLPLVLWSPNLLLLCLSKPISKPLSLTALSFWIECSSTRGWSKTLSSSKSLSYASLYLYSVCTMFQVYIGPEVHVFREVFLIHHIVLLATWNALQSTVFYDVLQLLVQRDQWH